MNIKPVFVIYNSHIAKQYKSYRPELHKIILDQYLNEGSIFPLALDIGCGVGHSTVALLPFCDRIIGIDNSEDMLQLASQHQKIIFEKSNLPELSYANHSIDLITFAGSLFYCKSQELVNECLRVIKGNGKILVYDFDIRLENIIKTLCSFDTKSDYDHTINFSGLNTGKYILSDSCTSTINIDIEISNLIHLLFADEDLLRTLSNQFGIENIEDQISKELLEGYPKGQVNVNADLYCSLYTCKE